MQRYTVINVKKCVHVKYSLFSSDFNETWIFPTDFRTNLKCQVSSESVQWEPSCSMRADGRTDRQTDMTKLIVVFRIAALSPLHDSLQSFGQNDCTSTFKHKDASSRALCKQPKLRGQMNSRATTCGHMLCNVTTEGGICLYTEVSAFHRKASRHCWHNCDIWPQFRHKGKQLRVVC
jgi:hypothetical protein